ncbi:MAG: AEC family transporter [Anaerolineaceae bacterium]|nr:AEC family transporter [Anaerolineaceae bacterium]
MLQQVLDTAVNTITPILLCVLAGAWFGRRFRPEPRVFSRLSLYVFLPALVVRSLATSDVNFSEILPIGLTVFSVAGTMALLGWVMSRLQPALTRPTRSAFILTILLFNSGNYGLPFIEFALGSNGLQYATIILVFSSMMTHSLGIFIASSGSSSPTEGLLNILKNPLPYATALGFFLNVADVSLPLPVARTIDVLANGSIPILLMLLGVQLSRLQVKQLSPAYIRAIGLAATMRLFVSPIVVFLVTRITGVTGTAFIVLMLVLSMPTAVNSAVLSYEFGSDADFATPVILTSTIGSVVSLSILFTILTSAGIL